MCLAVPGKVIKIYKSNDRAIIEYGKGTKRHANISLVSVKIGDYVLVHAGFAIQKISQKEAHETLELFNELLAEGE